MAEQDRTAISYPYIDTDEIMLVLGVDQNSAYFGSPAQARQIIGILLDRASSWVRLETGWSDSELEDITDDMKSVIADAILQRVAHFYFQRLGVIRMDMAEHFRIMSNRAKMDSDEALVKIRKSVFTSENVEFPDDAERHTIKDE